MIIPLYYSLYFHLILSNPPLFLEILLTEKCNEHPKSGTELVEMHHIPSLLTMKDSKYPPRDIAILEIY